MQYEQVQERLKKEYTRRLRTILESELKKEYTRRLRTIQLKKEYTRRLRTILESELNARNKITAVGALAVPALRYSFGIIHWRLE